MYGVLIENIDNKPDNIFREATILEYFLSKRSQIFSYHTIALYEKNSPVSWLNEFLLFTVVAQHLSTVVPALPIKLSRSSMTDLQELSWVLKPRRIDGRYKELPYMMNAARTFGEWILPFPELDTSDLRKGTEVLYSVF